MNLPKPGPTNAAFFLDKETKDEPYTINTLGETRANANLF